MKKRSRVKRSSARKSSSRKNTQHEHVFLLPFSFRRIVIVSTCIALLVGFVFVKGAGRQSVAGINIAKGLFVQSTITMPKVEGAVSYNIYYKKESEGVYKNAVRDISPSVDQYTISYLTENAKYTYRVAAVDSSGAEAWFSEERLLTDLQPM